MSQQRKKRITLRDVAILANVSEKTVSNVIHNWPFVSDDTRQRVKRALADTGYRPSQIARSLVTGRTYTVGIVVPDISNPFFSTAFRGCEDTLTAHEYSVFLCNTDEDLEKEKYYLESLIDRGVDGLILWGSRADAGVLCEYVTGDVPVVSVDGSAQSGVAGLTAIHIDNVGASECIVGHLIEHGRQRVAHIMGSVQRPTSQERLCGYRRALEAANLTFDPLLVVKDSPSIAGGHTAMLKLLQSLPSGDPIDALFCYNDLMAIGALAALEEMKLKVPDDVAVAGFDDIAPAALVTPMLTTICVPQYDLGQSAATELIRRLETANLPASVTECPWELKIRNSCGARRMSSEERLTMLHQMATAAGVGLSVKPVAAE